MPKGIKETKEFFAFIEAVRDAAIREIRDGGVEASDALRLAMDSEVQRHAVTGLEGVAEIGAELEDANLDEQRELAKMGVDFVFDTREKFATASDEVNLKA